MPRTFVLGITAACALAAATGAQTPSERDGLASIRGALDAGQFERADREAQRVSTTLPPSLLLDANDLRVEAAVKNGRWGDADVRALAQSQVDARRIGPNERLIVALLNSAELNNEASEYTDALRDFEQIKGLMSSGAPVAPTEAARYFAGYAETLGQVGRRDEAAATAEEAVGLFGSVPAPSALLARALISQGIVALWQGRYGVAQAALRRAVDIREGLGRSHPDSARALMWLGVELNRERQLEASRATLEDACAIAEETLRPEHPFTATCLRKLAVPLQDLGDLTRARSLQERALTIMQASVPAEAPAIAEQLNDLADTLRLQGDYTAAIPLLERALSIFEQRLGPQHSYTTTAVYNLSIVHALLGDRERAIPLHQRAIASWERSYGRDHAVVAGALWEFAQLLSERSFDRDAQPIFERALAIRRRIFGNQHADVAQSLSSLAVSLAHTGRLTRARALSDEALRVWRSLAQPASPAFASSLMLHGRVLASQGDAPGAAEAFAEAKRIRESLLGANHPSVAEANVALAESLVRTGQLDDAFALGLEGEASGRSHLELLLRSLPERQALTYAATRPKGLNVLLSVASPPQSHTAFDAVIHGRSLIFDEIAVRHRTDAGLSDDDVRARTALESARQRLANLIIRGPQDSRADGYAASVRAAQVARDEAERTLSASSAIRRRERRRDALGFETVIDALPAESALVSFVRYDRLQHSRRSGSSDALGWTTVPAYVAFVLRSHAAAPTMIQLGRAADIDQLIADWRVRLVQEVTVGAQAGSPSARSAGANVRRRIWDPLAADLSGATRVFIVPDGAINLVPFAALPTVSRRYLIEDGPTFHYLSSERDLVLDDAPMEPGNGLLAIGSPSFSDPSSFAPGPTRSRATLASATELRGASPCDVLRDLRFDSLPGSGEEAAAIASLWRSAAPSGSTQDVMLTGATATEAAFKRLGPGRKVLHIATHGFFLGADCGTPVIGTRSVGRLVPTVPRPPTTGRATSTVPVNPLLLSGLALAGANRRNSAGPNDEDGILTAEEVSGLDLDGVEWAVLSACDTGLGTVTAGEGVFGLRRAFRMAGVRTVVMSLWPVADQPTRSWMEALYRVRLVQHRDTADSIRDAALSVLRDRRAKGQSTSPFYWAAFVASGDWR